MNGCARVRAAALLAGLAGFFAVSGAVASAEPPPPANPGAATSTPDELADMVMTVIESGVATPPAPVPPPVPQP